MLIPLKVNGRDYQVDADPTTPLLWVLRDLLGLTGTKYGCGIEICGACTVLVDGQAEKSCHYEVKEAIGRQITTIEGLSANRTHPLQVAWIAEQVPQCGYCQSGMLMRAAAIMREHPGATPAEIEAELTNVCVCGTYQRIRAGIARAVAGG
jgi:aerobic-type carbon monoxide dehydrogenase small subunit (CoxS/CutS family)